MVVTFAFACFGVTPDAHAISPAPDGGYPGGNTAEGQNALFSLTSGTYNTAVGLFSLRTVTTGAFNTGVGAGTLFVNTGSANTATGAGALLSNTDGAGNTADGTFALGSNVDGSSNTAVGSDALLHCIGSNNTAVGSGALDNATGFANVALGFGAGSGVFAANDVICIGTEVAGADVSHTAWIGNVYGMTTQSGTTAPVIVSDSGQLGTVASSERFKKDIANMEKASEAILSLRPVTFHYKTDVKGISQFGLIAEEVVKVNPALVLPDKEGKPYTVRYDAVNAMLLNEFLKEHSTVQELKKEVAALTAIVKEQASQIQKVSAQLEVRKPGAQTVLNSR